MNTPWHDEDPAKMTLTDGGVLVKSKGEEHQLKIAEKVEAEHEDVFNEIESLMKKAGAKMPWTRKEFFRQIGKAHTKEIREYYDPYLLAMEKKAKAEEGK